MHGMHSGAMSLPLQCPSAAPLPATELTQNRTRPNSALIKQNPQKPACNRLPSPCIPPGSFTIFRSALPAHSLSCLFPFPCPSCVLKAQSICTRHTLIIPVLHFIMLHRDFPLSYLQNLPQFSSSTPPDILWQSVSPVMRAMKQKSQFWQTSRRGWLNANQNSRTTSPK